MWIKTTTTFFLVLLLALSIIHAHDDLGLHCLEGGAHPPYHAPNITALNGGPFEVKLQLRIDARSDDDDETTILSFTNSNNDTRFSLRLARQRLVVEWANSRNMVRAETDEIIRAGQTQQWTWGLQNDGYLWIQVLEGKKYTSREPVPSSSSNTLYTLSVLGASPFAGALLGLQVRNTAPQQKKQRLLQQLEHWNLPGQIHGGFVAHFYARWDNLHTRQWQHVMDMGIDDHDSSNENGIVITQEGRSPDLLFGYHVEGEQERHTCTARNALVEAEMAFWHVGAEPNGTMWIQKNDDILVRCHDKPLPKRVFRRRMRFGESGSEALADPLDGVVLGFRVDLHHKS